ncbi:sensor histidine kinase [Lutispora sp.]|uniref:sensor histidine kinase n=1 Tax=Lutispora sp. TaxID=2828727 RepID=UPI002B214294|nr:ATP-binding protein [Lutispora sp.]MEA4962234.1 GHKL domain-containing protein [Lutispora sp.]
MHGKVLFILTIMEIVAFLILWSALSIKLSKTNLIKIAIVAIVLPLVAVITDYYNFKYGGVVNYILAFFILHIMFKRPLKEAFTSYLISLALSFFIQMFSIFILNSLGYLYDEIYTFDNAFKVNVVFILINFFVFFLMPYNKMKKSIEEEFSKASFAFLNIALYTVIIKISWDINREFIWSRLILFVLISILLLFLNVIFLRNSIEIREQKKIIQTYNKYSPVISNLIEDVRRKQHGFKNHLNTIYGIVQVSEGQEVKEKIKSYIQSVNNDLKDLDLLIQLNNKVLCGIIYSKYSYAKEQGIDFRFNVESDLSNSLLEDYELSEVLNVLLDNAFEAVTSAVDKLVELTIGKDSGNSFIQVKSSGEKIKPENIAKIFERGFSTKCHKGRGYGLYNVKKIVESIKGQIQISFDDDFTIFKITL